MLVHYGKLHCNVKSENSLIAALEEGTDFYDEKAKMLFIPDIGDNYLYGVMTCPFDPDHFIEQGDFDAARNPVEWALSSVPAPGTGAPDRMGLMSCDEFIEYAASHAEDLRDPHTRQY